MSALPELMTPTADRPGWDASQPRSTVTRVNPITHPDWDALVAAHPDHTFFHGHAWAKVLHETYGHEPLYVCRLHDGHLEELLPVMEVASRFTGRRGVMLPFTDLCSPFCLSGVQKSTLFTEALQLAQSRNWNYLECRGGISCWDRATPSVAYYGHHLNLVAGEDRLFEAMESSVRRGVRKARNAGIKIRFATDLDSVRVFYELHCRTRQRHGVPPQPFGFFENIARFVLAAGCGWVARAEYEDRTVAAAIFFHLGRHAVYKFGASEESSLPMRPNNLLMWEAIRYYASQGLSTLHFGRTSLSNEGLRRFKLGFGAQEEQIEYARFDLTRARFVTGQDRAEGPLNNLFRYCPRSLLRTAGSLLYRHLS